jgi:DNA mismatch repair protein MutL
VPLTSRVTVSEAELVEQYQSLLEKLGLVIQRSTPTTLLIRELPLVLSGADANSLVMDVLSILKHYDEDRDKQNDNLLKMLSRHANDSTAILPTTREINLLLAELQHIKSQLTFDEYKTILRQLDMQSLHKLLNG